MGRSSASATTNAAMCWARLDGCVTRIHCNRRRSSESASTLAVPALIGAAADPGTNGQAISAIAVYGCFHDLPALASTLANDRFLPPFNWLFGHLGLAIADLQTGADLTGFSPALEAQSLWPRPIFIVNGSDDVAFPMEMGRELYESAPQPKRARWVNGRSHDRPPERSRNGRRSERVF